MTSPVVDPTTGPRVEEILEAFETLWFRPVGAERLAGYDDLNFRLARRDGRRFVLKLSPAASGRRRVDLVSRLLERLEAAGQAGVPRLVPSAGGGTVQTVEVSGELYLARLQTWVEGRSLAELEQRPPELMDEIGAFLGRLDLVLSTFEGLPERPIEWDPARLESGSRLLDAPADIASRRWLRRLVDDFLGRRAERLDRLPRGLIHLDANDHNVLVSSLEPGVRLAGLIDFGDATVTETVHELAIAMAYLGLGRSDPWGVALPAAVGYHRERPLGPAEVELLLPALRARLVISVAMAAHRRASGTADEYALISEAGAWRSLRALDAMTVPEAVDSASAAIEEGGSGGGG